MKSNVSDRPKASAGRVAVGVMNVILTLAATAGLAAAQPAASDRVTVNFSGGLDVLPGGAYVFRGITQESNPEITLWPYGDLGLTFATAERGVKNIRLNLGTWNSLHTGSSGLGGASARIHYERNFYGSVGAGLSGDLTVTASYTRYTSPNRLFGTVKEVSVKAARADRVSPYALVAVELEGSSAADGARPGTYLELGLGPALPIGQHLTLTVPVKVGLSLRDYYQHPQTGVDDRFGYGVVGALLTRSFGTWNVHAGVDVMRFGKTTTFFNGGKQVKVTGLLGVGWAY